MTNVTLIRFFVYRVHFLLSCKQSRQSRYNYEKISLPLRPLTCVLPCVLALTEVIR